MNKIDDLFYNFINSNYAQIKLKESTISTYYNNYERYIKTYFSDHELSENNITKFSKQLLGFLNSKTVCDILTLLSNILKCSNINILITKPNCWIENVEIFTDQEWQRLQDYCITNLNYFNFSILLVMFTGIRPGELCALKLNYVDFKNTFLKIRWTMQRVKNLDKNAKTKTKIIIDTPKSVKSIREIPLVFDLNKLGQNLYKDTNSNIFLLTNKIDKYIEPRILSDKFKKLLKQLDIDSEDKNLYTIRHTFATHFYTATHDVKALSEILGHADVKTTLNRYVHSDLEQKREGLNCLVQNSFLQS